MARSGCSALHGVSPNSKNQKKEKKSAQNEKQQLHSSPAISQE